VLPVTSCILFQRAGEIITAMAAIPARDRSGSIKTWAERTTSGPTSPVALNSFTQTMEPAAASQDDAEWKQIQKKVFTRWCNERLKVVNIEVTQLPEDFSDGIKVINLVQVLSKKMIGRYSKKPRMYAQKMENVDLALKFLTKVEKIKIVNIGSGDIVNGNLKLTLGLIWTLILHYQISVGFKIDDKKGSSSAKQVLAEYVQVSQISYKTKVHNNYHSCIIVLHGRSSELFV
jgi:filamin